MNVIEMGDRGRPRPSPGSSASKIGLIGLGLVAIASVVSVYNSCKIEVGTGQQAVLIRKVGIDLDPEMELAPAPKQGGSYYKGVQSGGPNNGVLTEGRYFYNPIYWDWEITPQFVVPDGKIGIRIALSGEELPAGQILAEPGQKGILAEVMKPGRYPYNPRAEIIELKDPVTVPAGYRGVVTLLSGPISTKPNEFLVESGKRGVQERTLEPGTYYLNPYQTRVSLVDCKSHRFNLGQGTEMDFLSSDGFPITLDGAVEFRVMADKVSDVFVKYNEAANGDEIDEEIIAKIITPESRALCRIGGSKLTGGEFIKGESREKFQRPGRATDKELQEARHRDPRGGNHIDSAPRGDRRPGARPRSRQATARSVQAGRASAAFRGTVEGSRSVGDPEEGTRRGRASRG